MDTIRTYLDNMFLSLPRTPETLRAKEELYSMMEDKYAELKASGKSEHEAIGTVIAEFGNLEELAEELHLNRQDVGSESSTDTEAGRENTDSDIDYTEPRMVSVDEAEDYLNASKRSAFRIALGVFLCIFSPVPLIYLVGLSEFSDNHFEAIATAVGVLALFLCIGAGVLLFVFNGMREHEYDYLKKEPFRLDFGTASYLGELYSQFRSAFAVQITVGVMLCIFSIVPVTIAGILFEENEMLLIICVCLLLLMIAAGVFLFVHSGIISESYKVLLQKEEFSFEQKSRKSGKGNAVREAVLNSYWLIVTAGYLGWSFLSGDWGTTWIVWPIAAVLQGVVESILKVKSTAQKN